MIQCVFCNEEIKEEQESTRFTDGTKAHDYCWEKAQEYIQDAETIKDEDSESEDNQNR